MRKPAVALALAISLAAPDLRAADPQRTKPGYLELFATTFVGDGLRFNNPYRLATPLGSNAESVSRTAAYADLGAAAVIGDPFGLRHGAALRWSIAIEGVRQSVFTPAYLLWRKWTAWGVYGRAGVPIVVSPSLTWGGEVGVGAAWFARGGIAIATEIVGDLYYGAGTREVRTPAYPVLSGQIGLLVDYEVLP